MILHQSSTGGFWHSCFAQKPPAVTRSSQVQPSLRKHWHTIAVTQQWEWAFGGCTGMSRGVIWRSCCRHSSENNKSVFHTFSYFTDDISHIYIYMYIYIYIYFTCNIPDLILEYFKPPPTPMLAHRHYRPGVEVCWSCGCVPTRSGRKVLRCYQA